MMNFGIHAPSGLPTFEAAGEHRVLACLPPQPGRCQLPRFDRPIIPRSDWREWMLRDWCPDVYDQGPQGSCVGHGAVIGFTVSFTRSGQKPRRFSPCFIYAQINNGADQGAIVSDSLEELKQTGVCLEATVGPRRIWKRDIPAGAYDEARRYRIEQAYQLRSFEEIVTATLLGFPVVYGIEIGSHFQPDAEGYIPDRAGRGGGHCMCGIGPKRRQGRWYLTTINSWSAQWGAGGYCHLPESYFDGYVDAFAVQAAREDEGDNDEPPTGAD
jgi:hypothetical protein